ncbi:MAG: tRNA preQ1(34) S-adenosylmethionine ribosyltransferase-isomerase QueA [Gammaproteobacteria bacterium]|nr:tRNA preQ1(34) S-adenosylmethionine ribosyltransferase-isomerase QueA [Gammaproteobacteria bacterium]
MRKSDFNYSLPRELVAQHPVSPRSASRLLHLDSARGERRDLRFADLPGLLRAGDLLVFNDTRVIPARLFGIKESGGRVEILIERFHDTQHALAQLRASKPPQPGQRIHLEGGVSVTVRHRAGEFYEIEFPSGSPALEILDRFGHVPLPPYIDRADESADRERYQTVYARRNGAVAAPTAGLHFDEPMLVRLQAMGVETAFITLHVGAGTFQPLRVDDIRQHRMHAEFFSVTQATCDQINSAKKEGRRVVAVGTTVVRSLEASTENDRVVPFEGETDIFIFPGFQFRVADALLTNFHLPESTLLMLVCAFGGTQNVLDAYRHAVEQKYSFYSYGDAMFVTHAHASR